jgi:hypothetical protein
LESSTVQHGSPPPPLLFKGFSLFPGDPCFTQFLQNGFFSRVLVSCVLFPCGLYIQCRALMSFHLHVLLLVTLLMTSWFIPSTGLSQTDNPKQMPMNPWCQTHLTAQRINSLLQLNSRVTIGFWKVRTLHQTGKLYLTTNQRGEKIQCMDELVFLTVNTHLKAG